METLLIHPKNEKQLEAIKAFMKEQNINFESKKDELPSHLLQSINRGLSQANNGDTISFEEFKSKHFKS
ncbi:DUF2683 family protein [Pedobacter fastidiosus]|uniref:Uncharacterized protein n=1 Tax=Pedobacter fastidiosus TaxID=2765361 RepID=A0ABR7KRH6_9SPHI|nr:DUF2683 family protein [Pedobacter fastidiosus]MBC6110608.1 hypothetical protein [Pedobacter fastidiosus]